MGLNITDIPLFDLEGALHNGQALGSNLKGLLRLPFLEGWQGGLESEQLGSSGGGAALGGQVGISNPHALPPHTPR